jgi:hypothetical protein
VGPQKVFARFARSRKVLFASSLASLASRSRNGFTPERLFLLRRCSPAFRLPFGIEFATLRYAALRCATLTEFSSRARSRARNDPVRFVRFVRFAHCAHCAHGIFFASTQFASLRFAHGLTKLFSSLRFAQLTESHAVNPVCFASQCFAALRNAALRSRRLRRSRDNRVHFACAALALRSACASLRSRNLLHGSLSCASPSFAQ